MEIADVIRTPRLLMRRPRRDDAEAVFSGWASDPVATRYLSWSTHEAIADTIDFLGFSDDEWARWPLGPLLIEDVQTGVVLGSSGLAFETDRRAEVGYVFAPSAWGQGYATEAVAALVTFAGRMAPLSLFAHVHPDNTASIRVLEKCGFAYQGRVEACKPFPNLGGDRLCDAIVYSYDIG